MLRVKTVTRIAGNWGTCDKCHKKPEIGDRVVMRTGAKFGWKMKHVWCMLTAKGEQIYR